MNQDLAPLKQAYPDHFTNYMDNITIGMDNSEEGHWLHHEIVHKFLETLQEHSYFLKVSKCEFKKDQINFLGFRLGHQTVKINPTKIGGIVDWP
jgi:Reverse transcriptase (RNA-dependent DNA polymerase)